MKKIFVILMTCIITTFFACNGNQSLNIKDDKFTIVTSFYPMYLFTKSITKGTNNVEVINMTESHTGCIHEYQLTTNDMKAFEKANAFVINGGGLEEFLPNILKSYSSMNIIDSSKNFNFIKAKDGSINPHVWVSISGAIYQIKNIADSLVNIDTENSKVYQKNANHSIKKLEELKNKMILEISQLKNKNIVTTHESMPYFANEFSLNTVATIEHSSSKDISTKELSNTIEAIKNNNVKAIFIDSEDFIKLASTVSTETGVKIYNLNLIANGPKNVDMDYYINSMEENLSVLKEALK